jgi:nucleoside-diphosphate-sugar epimerase
MAQHRALIGFTGFVGSNLADRATFDALYNSSNIQEMRGRSHSLVVCAGVSAVKWEANRDPEADWRSIGVLLNVLGTISTHRLVLISTIDVYPVQAGADESFDCASGENHPYGTHRLSVERFCLETFPSVLILRLPALFGPGLKKNVIFDLLNRNALEAINPSSSFQYYDVRDLWDDYVRVEAAGLGLVNLFTEPIRTGDILEALFPGTTVGAEAPRQEYDLHTRHASLRGRTGPYLYGRAEIMTKLGAFVEDERRRT